MPHFAAFRRWFGCRDGNVVVTFALASLPLLAFTGVAIDYGIATRTQVKLQAATDATALALCQTPNSYNTAALTTKATVLVSGYMGTTNWRLQSLVLVPATESTPRTIALQTQIDSATFFSAFTRLVSPKVNAPAQCTTPLPKTFEIALVLDNTGSMAQSAGGKSKMQSVIDSATSFINNVKSNPAFSPQSRISLVPFAASVRVDPTTYSTASWIDQNGKSSFHWNNVLNPTYTSRFDIFNVLQAANANWGWGGCFEKLPYPLNVQDAKPTPGNADSYYVPLLAPDEPGDGTVGAASYYDPTAGATYGDTNSYINDSTGAKTCSSNPSLSFMQQEGRSCKYKGAIGASYNVPNTNTVNIGQNGPNFGCNSAALMRLTTNFSSLINQIDMMKSAGTTDIQEGLEWGWRTISPNSVFGDGSAYGTSDVSKIVILMTDGTNDWLANPYSPNGSVYTSAGYFKNADGTTANSRLPPSNQNVNSQATGRAALDALTATTCANIKNANIAIYTIGFSVPQAQIDPAGINLLTNCATDSSHAFVANDATSLNTTFNKILQSIGALRISQ